MIYYLLFLLTAMMGLFLYLAISYFKDEEAKISCFICALFMLLFIGIICTSHSKHNENNPVEVETSHP